MKLPDFRFEKRLWKRGLRVVGGVDEVGRGCFAGPVVAGCVVFSNLLSTNYHIPVTIDDSKKLRPRQREQASKWIYDNSLTWGIGEAPASLINRIGIAKASRIAFRRAISQANSKLKAESHKLSAVSYLLIDAFFIPYTRGLARKNQMAIVNGDEKVISIAAASIIAKVYRDALMRKISNRRAGYSSPKLQVYKWGRNKGYGTREHQEAIKKYGLTRYHRKKFVATWRQKHV